MFMMTDHIFYFNCTQCSKNNNLNHKAKQPPASTFTLNFISLLIKDGALTDVRWNY